MHKIRTIQKDVLQSQRALTWDVFWGRGHCLQYKGAFKQMHIKEYTCMHSGADPGFRRGGGGSYINLG